MLLEKTQNLSREVRRNTFPGILGAVLLWGAWDTRRRRRAEGADYRRFTPPPA